MKNKNKIAAIIQVRLSSTRLPEKILKFLPYNSNITVLEQIVNRLKKSSFFNTVIVATTDSFSDDKLIKLLKKMNVDWFRGSEENVLERYYLAAKKFEVDTIIRITADRPCIDIGIVDFVLNEHIANGYDYTSNTLQKTFPVGFEVEVFSFESLERMYHMATNQFEKEHVTPYIYRTAPEEFKIKNIVASTEIRKNAIRLTLDVIEDYTLLCEVYDNLYEINPFFNVYDVVNLFNEKPWLFNINSNVLQKGLRENLEDEMLEAVELLHKYGLHKPAMVLESREK